MKIDSSIKIIKRNISIAILFIFNYLPIKKNKIFLFSYYGSQYGCNPKYISEYILKNYPKGKFDLVWAFNDLTTTKHISGVRKVKSMSLKYFYEICTSKIIITNFRTTELFKKRKDQYYIQTWHSSLRLKQIEKDAEEVLPQDYVQMAKEDSEKIDLLISGCQYSTKIFKESFWYKGPILERGTPRNDQLFKQNVELREGILNKLNIPVNFKAILYAPTFRKDNSLEAYNLDYSKILEKVKDKFGGNWVFLLRLHPHLINKSSELKENVQIINVTKYEDIQELLIISDVLISDYSSLIFDFLITGRPCFLYVPDFFDYINQDRKLYFDLKELPFYSATSNQVLLEQIDEFKHEEYNKKLSDFLLKVGSFEDGKACENLVKRIYEVCFS